MGWQWLILNLNPGILMEGLVDMEEDITVDSAVDTVVDTAEVATAGAVAMEVVVIAEVVDMAMDGDHNIGKGHSTNTDTEPYTCLFIGNNPATIKQKKRIEPVICISELQ